MKTKFCVAPLLVFWGMVAMGGETFTPDNYIDLVNVKHPLCVNGSEVTVKGSGKSDTWDISLGYLSSTRGRLRVTENSTSTLYSKIYVALTPATAQTVFSAYSAAVTRYTADFNKNAADAQMACVSQPNHAWNQEQATGMVDARSTRTAPFVGTPYTTPAVGTYEEQQVFDGFGGATITVNAAYTYCCSVPQASGGGGAGGGL